MGFLRQLAGAVVNGAQTGLRIAQVEEVLVKEYGHRLTRPQGQQRLDELINFLPPATPICDIATCYMAVEVRLGFVATGRRSAVLEVARRWYKEGRISEQMLRELCAAVGKGMSTGLY